MKKAHLSSKRRRPASTPVSAPAVGAGLWTFLTNHAHVLHCLYQQPEARLRDVALHVGITERMVQRIVAELVEAGYLQVTKIGRCNQYEINSKLKLRHPMEVHQSIGKLLKILSTP